MKIITATVKQQNLIIASSVISVAETVGAYALKIMYDEEWADADKIVTFKNSAGVAIAVEDTGSEDGVIIPWEILRCPGKVTVGVMGYIGSEQKLATTGIYERNTFIVLPAAFGLQEAMTPTPDIYQKLIQTIETTQSQIGDLANLNTEAKNNLVAAINEVLAGGGATGTVKSVNNIEPDSAGNVSLNTSQIPNTSGYQTGTQVANAIAAEAAARSEADSQLSSGINTIESKIPTQASSSNQLADKNFVNSSVATNTANYISNNGEPFTSLADLEAYSGALTNNDYAFVVGADAQGNTTYTRYKYVASTESWAEEYVLNNSSFTAEQWAAISSGITSGLVEKLGDLVAIKSLGANLNLGQDGELSATDTTYSDFTGTDGTAAGAHGLVPAPATTDAGKFLKADGTWGTAGGGMREVTSADFNWPTANPDGVATWLLPDGVYFSKATKLYFNTNTNVTGNRSFIKSTTGNGNLLTVSFYGNSGGDNVNVYLTNTNGTDAWSNTIASLADIYADPSTKKQVRIGNGATANKNPSVAVGDNAYCTAQYGVALGPSSHSQSDYGVAIGYNTYVNSTHGVALGEGASVADSSLYSVALGAGTSASGRGVISAKMTGGYAGQGYNATDYHLLTGIYDGQSDHDAVNLSQLNGRVLQNAGAPTTATVGTVGQLLEDTTNGKLYICTAVDTTDPQNPSYTWTEVGAGGGGGSYTAGDGIDITNNAISITGAAKTLTSADYNYPTNSPDGVALWLLAPGTYAIPSGTKWYTTSTASCTTNPGLAIIRPEDSNNVGMVYCRGLGDWLAQSIVKATGVRTGTLSSIMTTDFVIDGLTSTASTAPLSANQGKVLNDHFDAITPVGGVIFTTSSTAPTVTGQTWTSIGSETFGSETIYGYKRTA